MLLPEPAPAPVKLKALVVVDELPEPAADILRAKIFAVDLLLRVILPSAVTLALSILALALVVIVLLEAAAPRPMALTESAVSRAEAIANPPAIALI